MYDKYICICIYIYKSIVCVCVCGWVLVCVCIYIYVYIYISSDIYICIYTYKHTHTHTHTHIGLIAGLLSPFVYLWLMKGANMKTGRKLWTFTVQPLLEEQSQVYSRSLLPL